MGWQQTADFPSVPEPSERDFNIQYFPVDFFHQYISENLRFLRMTHNTTGMPIRAVTELTGITVSVPGSCEMISLRIITEAPVSIVAGTQYPVI